MYLYQNILDNILGKKQRKDVEVQFSYLQPVSGTIALHHCNGM